MPPSYVFVIDISLAAINNGYLASVIESIKDMITNDAFLNKDRTRVGIITYDATTNFYNLNPKLSQPQMLTIRDDIFLPAPLEFLIPNIDDVKDTILNLLDLIRDSTPNSQACKDSGRLIEAIKAAFLLVQGTGGKIVAFNASNSFAGLVNYFI